MNTPSPFGWSLFCLSVVVLVYLGIRANRVVRKDTVSGFLLAGRSLGVFVGSATVVASGFSGWAFIGSPGVAYQYGTVELLTNFMFSPAMVLAILFFGDYLRRRAQELNSLTIPEYIAAQHAGGLTGRFIQGLAAVLTIVLLSVFLISQIKALGLLASSLLGLSVSTSAIVLMSIIIIYTTVGGMAAIAWTDGVMVIGMTIGAVLLVTAIFGQTTPSELIDTLAAADRELVYPTTGEPYGTGKLSVFLMLPYAFLFTLCLPHMANRILAFKKSVRMHTAALFVAIFTCILSITPIAGLYARAYMAPLSEPDQAIIAVIDQLVGPFVGAVIGISVLFAIKSTTNSLLHAISSAVSHDLRKALVPGRKLQPEKVLFINRVTVVVIGVLGLLGMLYAPPFMLVWLGIVGTGSLLASFAAPILLSPLWLGNGFGALAAMGTGFPVSASMLLYFESGWVEGPLLGCAAGALAYYVVSKMTFSLQPRIGAEQIR